MRVGHLALAALAAAALLTGCERKAKEAPAPAPAPAAPAAPAQPAPPPVAAFKHEPAFDASGYFMPQTVVRSGTYQLRHVAVGSPSDFAQWEAGGRDVFGPIMFQFEDMSSPLQTNELGAEVHTVTARVLPESYGFSAGQVSFRGRDPKVGEVVFTGTFDAAAMAAAKQSGSSEYQPVLTGELQVGDTPVRHIAFNYWVGD